MKRGPHLNEKKKLSIIGLLNVIKRTFSTVIDSLKKSHRDRKINIDDCLMSALAMFSLKSPSLLAFDKGKAKTHCSEKSSITFPY